jgi:hypothetical protein
MATARRNFCGSSSGTGASRDTVLREMHQPLRARDNPFAVPRVLAIRYRLQNDCWEHLLRRLEALQYRAAILGQEGAGKTTLLEDLGARLRDRGRTPRFLRLNQHQPRFPRGFLAEFTAGLEPRDIVLLDGAEQLGWIGWRRFLSVTRAAGGLIITAHRAGLLPTLVSCRTSPELLSDIVRELLGGHSDELQSLLEALFTRHRGNIRDVLRELYDRCAATTSASCGGGFPSGAAGATVPVAKGEV